MSAIVGLFIISGALVALANGQAAAQGGFSVHDLIKRATTESPSGTTHDLVNKNINDVFGTPPTPTKSSTTTGPNGCTCVPYYLCNNGSINTNGEGVIDIRINDGPCVSYLDVCCGASDRASEPIQPTPSPVKKTGCGYRHPDGIGFRITGDKENETQFGEFPWMVAVLREESIDTNPTKLNVYQCGGSLVHPQVVVTAAHCVSGKNRKFRIRAGEWDTQQTKELYPHQDRDVSKIEIHPQYYAGALYNDVAVLYLETPVEITENVDTICLPPQATTVDAGTTCYATGWGKDVFGQKGKYQVILKKTDLPIVANDDCQSKLRMTRLGKFFELHKSFICAGGAPGKDTCKGDGGSPLVCPIAGQTDRYYQAGIVAWGIGCGENNTPGVYVNVPLFRDWIDSQIKKFGLENSSYLY